MIARGFVLTLAVGSAGCGGVSSDPGHGPDASVTVGWRLVDAASNAMLLCELGETVNIRVGDTTASAPCAGSAGLRYADGILNKLELADLPSGPGLMEVTLTSAIGNIVGSVQREVTVGDGPYHPVTIPVTATGSVGSVGFTWQLISPDMTSVCSGRLRDSMVFESGGQSHAVAAADWADANLPAGPLLSGVYTAIMPSIPIGARQVTVRLVDTQTGSTQAQTTLQPTSIAGRTTIAEHFVFPVCP